MKESPTSILQRIAEKDRTAVNECLDRYGNLVWALAKKFTSTEAEAEIAVEQIFQEIWNCSYNLDLTKNSEVKCVLYIVFRHIFVNSNSPQNNLKSAKQERINGLQTFLELKSNLVFLNSKL